MVVVGQIQRSKRKFLPAWPSREGVPWLKNVCEADDKMRPYRSATHEFLWHLHVVVDNSGRSVSLTCDF